MAGRLQVVMEYASHGNLRNFLRCHRVSTASTASSTSSSAAAAAAASRGVGDVVNDASDILTARRLLTFSYQIAAGMQHLASMKVTIRTTATTTTTTTDATVYYSVPCSMFQCEAGQPVPPSGPISHPQKVPSQYWTD